MHLQELLDLTQSTHESDWVVLPAGGPADALAVGLIDTSADDENPAVGVLTHMHRSIYAPAPELGLAWGMDERDWRSTPTHPTDPPAWADLDWNSVAREWAHVLLNGAMVWQVGVASIDWGSGISGVLPWPRPDHTLATDPTSYRTTRWEVDFAALLNVLAGNDQFEFQRELEATNVFVDDAPPLAGLRR